MKLIPFWVDDFPRPENLTSPLPPETDYLIVGAGLTGLSAALRLSEAGKSVTVIDAGAISSGASAINGGMVSPDIKAGVETVHGIYGPKIAAEMWAASVRSVEIIDHLDERLGLGAITHRGGMAALGHGTHDLGKFDRTVKWYRDRFAVEWQVIDARDIHEIVGGDRFNVALYEPEGYGIHPARFAFGLAKAVRRAGAILVDGCRALGLNGAGSTLEVTTSQGTVRAGDVVLATNGYTTTEPSRELSRLVVPVGSYIIATEPVGAEVADRIFPTGAMTYTKKRLLNYMRRTHDDRILLGGRRNLHTGLDLEQSAADLRRAMVGYWPELADFELTHAWGGKLAVPFDLIPHIGRIDGAWYAMGYAGHGVGLSVQCGHELAGMLLGEDPPSVFSQIPHQGRFYYNGRNPWFLTPASILYQTLDRVGM